MYKYKYFFFCISSFRNYKIYNIFSISLFVLHFLLFILFKNVKCYVYIIVLKNIAELCTDGINVYLKYMYR